MADKIKILIVDDDKHIIELIGLYLTKENYDVVKVSDGGEVMNTFNREKPDLVLLDLMLPVVDGYQLCKQIRQISQVPIIMLTSKSDTFDKVLGLELGADDYITKPFETSELLARIKAVLRRYNDKKVDTEKITLDGLEIDPTTYVVTYHGLELNLPPKEFELLYFFANNPNQVFSRNKLLNQIWGYDFSGDTRTVDVHIKRIREKMNNPTDTYAIKTVWGIGYKFENL